MVQFGSSKETFEIADGGSQSVPKKRWYIVLVLCAIFAILALIFVILYATETKKAEPVSSSGNQGGKFQILLVILIL